MRSKSPTRATQSPTPWRLETPIQGQPVLIREPLGPLDPRRMVAGEPRLVHRAGRPAFSLTLLLEEFPAGGADRLSAFTGAALALEIDCLAEESAREALALAGRPAEHLVPVRARFSIQEGERIVAINHLEGAARRAAVSAQLNSADAQRVLDAARGALSGLVVVIRLEHAVSASKSADLCLKLDLGRAQRFLAERVAEERQIFERDLLNHWPALLESEALTVDPLPPSPAAPEPRLLDLFLQSAGPILRPAPESNQPQLGRAFLLSAMPLDGMRVERRIRAGERVLEPLELSAPLERVLCAAGPLDGPASVSFVAPGSDGLPRLVPWSSAGLGSRGASALGLAQWQGSTLGLALASKPSKRPASTLGTLLGARPPGRIQQLAVHDLRIQATQLAGGTSALRSLPVVERADLPLWPDRRDAKKRWYAPELAIVQPAGSAEPADAPFLFRFEAQGHGADGQAGLEAEIQITLEARPSASTQAALAGLGDLSAQAVTPRDPALWLEIPFREAGATRTFSCAAERVEVLGNRWTASFRLADQWVRVAYGALSRAGFQNQPARVRAAYGFEAYVPVPAGQGQVLWGGKLALAPQFTALAIARPGGGSRGLPTTGLAYEAGGFRFEEQRQRAALLPGLRPVGRLQSALIRPQLFSPAAIAAPLHAFQPAAVTGAATAIQQPKYGIQTRVQDQRIDVLYPCAEVGQLYLEHKDGRDRAVGCLEAFELGSARLELYQRIEDLETETRAGLDAYRSLQSPGRFLIVPRCYRLARCEPDDAERAWRPAIFIYSAMDPEDLLASRCFLLATLEPDLTPLDRWRLEREFARRFHPDPRLEYLTALEGEERADWPLPSGAGTGSMRAQTTRSPEGVQVSIETDAVGLQQLQSILSNSGLTGSLRLTLPDGKSLSTTLRLALDEVIGPWSEGPIEISLAGRTARLENRIEQPVDLTALWAIDERQTATEIPVARRLAPGESVEVEVPGASRRALLDAQIDATDIQLTELRTFVEEIQSTFSFQLALDLAAEGLDQLAVRARIQGLAGEQAIQLDAQQPLFEARFLLPLTRFLAEPVLEFQVERRGREGRSDWSPWHAWPIHRNGVIVPIDAARLPPA